MVTACVLGFPCFVSALRAPFWPPLAATRVNKRHRARRAPQWRAIRAHRMPIARRGSISFVCPRMTAPAGRRRKNASPIHRAAAKAHSRQFAVVTASPTRRGLVRPCSIIKLIRAPMRVSPQQAHFGAAMGRVRLERNTAWKATRRSIAWICLPIAWARRRRARASEARV